MIKSCDVRNFLNNFVKGSSRRSNTGQNKLQQSNVSRQQTENCRGYMEGVARMNMPMVKISPIEKIDKKADKHNIENYKGCLLGGAIGDSLGGPVEFYRLSEIKRRYGQEGITELEPCNYIGKAEITDDTQMTIFTADGLIKSALDNQDLSKIPNMDIIYNSYEDWLATQFGQFKANQKGWIANIKDLYARRAPGTTCIGSLMQGIMGSIEEPINSSKGCGGVMRVAPVGLMYYENPKLAFEIGARCAALTHGSPDAYLPAGVHASIIADVIKGNDIQTAVDNAISTLKEYEGHQGLLELIENAKLYANSNLNPEIAIRKLGEGWHGDEAIAIAIYCILKFPDNFEKAVITAVNHDGDSDSTGAIVGNILGAYLGSDKIPQRWKQQVELAEEISKLSLDLYVKPSEIEDSKIRYSLLK